MINLTYKDRPDSLEYFNNLSYDRRVFFDRPKVINTMIYEKALADTEKQLAIDSLSVGLGEGDLYVGDEDKFGGSKRSRELILEYLIDVVGPKRQHMLKVYDKQTRSSRYSLDKNNVLTPLIDAGIATEFLTEFTSYREHNKAAGDMAKKVKEKFNPTDVEGISEIQYMWTRALTGRLYTNNENIQNIAKLYLSAMCGPSDEYLLVWGDFDQIDLRVAYYTVLSESPEDDAIFEQYDDKYEAIARIIDRKLGREFNIDNFKENRKKYKKGILARCYGQSLSQLSATVGDKDFCKMLDKYFQENDRYSSWYSSVVDTIQNCDDIDVYTYFGSVCHVTLGDCSTSEQKVDRLLNCPIQGTSNDIIMHMTNKTVQDMRAMGVNEDMFRVYMIRHDEPIFLIHKSCLKYLSLIRRNTVMQVDDWGPITMSLGIGKYYSVDEYEGYKDYFGDEDVASGAVKVHRDKYYEPFSNPEDRIFAEQKYMPIRLVGDSTGMYLTVGDVKYPIDGNKHKRLQINDILASYIHSVSKTPSMTFDATDFPIQMYNMYVNGVYLYFHYNKGV